MQPSKFLPVTYFLKNGANFFKLMTLSILPNCIEEQDSNLFNADIYIYIYIYIYI